MTNNLTSEALDAVDLIDNVQISFKTCVSFEQWERIRPILEEGSITVYYDITLLKSELAAKDRVIAACKEALEFYSECYGEWLALNALAEIDKLNNPKEG